MSKIRYLDLFCGAGGMSEGFERAGYSPVAHIDIDEAACYTLKTRKAYKWLKKNGRIEIYLNYINGGISRDEFYSHVPKKVLSSVICKGISDETIGELFKSVDDFLGKNQLDLIIGGPPCQAYSVAGRARDKNGMVGDPRNFLFQYYCKFLERYKPKYFVFENVMGLKSAKNENGELYFDMMKMQFKELGYSARYEVLNANDYGVPQNRKRIILVGKLNGQNDYYPAIPQEKVDFTISDVLTGLPFIKAGEGKSLAQSISFNETQKRLRLDNELGITTGHWSRPNKKNDLEIYKTAVQKWNKNHSRLVYSNLPEELRTHSNLKSFQDRYKVVASDLKNCQTVVAHIAKDGHYFIHPDIKQNRSLTPREAARLQTFPDDYYFESANGKPARTSAYKQIGNAVPVILAEKIAIALKKDIKEQK